MNPTAEQADALSKFATGESLKIQACAGAGKTTTLKMLARQTTRSGLYLAFNKAIATEAASSFPPRIDCRTGHSLAFRAVGRVFAQMKRLRSQVYPWQILKSLGGAFDFGGFDEVAVVRRLLRAIQRFCESDRKRPGLGDFGLLEPERELDAALLTRGEDWLGALWARMSDLEGDAPVTHDVYLKVWALSEPRCPARFVMLDEAQDANGVLLGLLSLWERRDGAQIVLVGDSYQQIYSWRGATNAMERYETAHTAWLTQSFRYGEEIARTARVILSRLRGVDVPIRGTDSPDLVVLEEPARVGSSPSLPDAILTRTNAIALSEVIMLHDADVRVSVAGGVGDMIALLGAVKDLKKGKVATRGDLIGFATWDDVVAASEQEEGANLRVLVRTVEDYDLDELIELLRQLEGIVDPQVTVSTAHRSKGLEWEHVRLAGDFKVPEVDEDGVVHVEDEEAHLLYVAATRARTTLDVSCCPLALYAFELVELVELDEPSRELATTPTSDARVSPALLERLEDLARGSGVDVDVLLESMLVSEEARRRTLQGSLF